ncbi:MAG TPA: response regulator [Smithella sp.]|nr:response regulator [Smithella sp.]
MKDKIILLVEDNPDDVELTLRAFKKNHIVNKLIVAPNGLEALDYLFGRGIYQERDIKDLPVLIMLDLNLPKINGLEVLTAIRQNEMTRLLPVVVITSSNRNEDLLASYTLGANSYIPKPVDFNEFMEAVKVLGLYWLSWNKPPPLIH